MTVEPAVRAVATLTWRRTVVWRSGSAQNMGTARPLADDLGGANDRSVGLGSWSLTLPAPKRKLGPNLQ